MSLREELKSRFTDRCTKRDQISAKYEVEGYSWGTQFIRRGGSWTGDGIIYLHIEYCCFNISNIEILSLDIDIF